MANGMNQSERSRATEAAGAYGAAIQPTIDELNQQLNSAVSEMNTKIVSGMTEGEKAELQGRIEGLRTQYADAISRAQGQFAFAEQAAATSSKETQKGLRDVFAAQQALAAQALGQTAAAAPGQGYLAAVREANRAGRETAAAGLAVIGGEESVPAGAQVPVAGLAPVGTTTGGLIGISASTADLYRQMLEQSRARAITDLEAQRVALDQTIRMSADQAARQREAEERSRVESFRQQALMNIMNQTASMRDRLAQLSASAAGADSRTERQKAQAELDAFRKQEEIRLANDLKRLAAQKRAAGGTGQTAAEKAAAQLALNLDMGDKKVGSLINDRLLMFSPSEKIKYDPATGLATVTVTGGKPAPVDVQQMLYRLRIAVGAASTATGAQRKAVIQTFLQGKQADSLDAAERAVMKAMFDGRGDSADYWVGIMSGATKQTPKNIPPASVPPLLPTASKKPTKKPETRPVFTPRGVVMVPVNPTPKTGR